eukprot:g1157.t1
MDCTRMSCCERDLANQKKNETILAQLRDADPVRRAIRRRNQHKHITCRTHGRDREQCTEECAHDHDHDRDQDSSASSDSEFEDDDAFMQEMIRKRMEVAKISAQRVNKMIQISEERLKKEIETCGKVAVVLFARSDCDAESPVRRRLQSTAATYPQTRFLRADVTLSDSDAAAETFASFRRKCLKVKEVPSLVVAYMSKSSGHIESKAVALGAAFDAFGDLAVSDDRLLQWLKHAGAFDAKDVRKQAPKEGESAEEKDEEEEEEEEEPAFDCGREGCASRHAFYHQHVDSKMFTTEADKVTDFMKGT